MSEYCSAFNFAIFPVVSSLIFGSSGNQIASIILLAIGISAITGFLVSYYLSNVISYATFFYIAMGFTALSFVVMLIFKNEPLYTEKENESN